MKSCKHLIQPKHHVRFRKLRLFFTANMKTCFLRSQPFHKRQSNFPDPVCNARPGQGPTVFPMYVLEETKQNKAALHLPGISVGTELSQNLTLLKQLKTAFTPRLTLLTAGPRGNAVFGLYLIQLQAQHTEEIISIILRCFFQLIRIFFPTRAPVAEDDLRHQSERPFGCCAVREPQQLGKMGKVNRGFCWGGRRQICV